MKKKIIAIAAAVMALVFAVVGTLAYLTDEKTVVNTFSVGDVEIKLDEAKVNENGEPIDAQGNVVTELAKAERVAKNSYHMLPAHEYTKDPTVTVVKGSEESYIRILVTANKVSEWTTIYGPNFNLETIITGYNSEWERHSITPHSNDNKVTYEYWYKTTVTPTKDEDTVLPALFTGFTIPGEITNDQLKTVDGFEMTIVANAIQADGFETAEAAWAQFPTE